MIKLALIKTCVLTLIVFTATTLMVETHEEPRGQLRAITTYGWPSGWISIHTTSFTIMNEQDRNGFFYTEWHQYFVIHWKALLISLAASTLAPAVLFLLPILLRYLLPRRPNPTTLPP
jgi:hypothetical protein